MECFVDGGYQNNVYERPALETEGCEAGNNVTILICIFLFGRFELYHLLHYTETIQKLQDEQGTHNVTLTAFVHPILQWKSNKYYIF